MISRRIGAVSRREFLAMGGGALAGVALGVLPAQADKSCGKPKYGGHLRIGERYHAQTLDPHKQVAFIETMNAMLMFNGLTDRGSLPEVNIYPALAESWEISEDGRTYTFRLRAAKFHNGKEVTAADVKYSIGRIRDPKTASPRERDLFALDSVDVVDRRTVRLNLKEAYGPMLHKLTVQVTPIIPEGTSYTDGTPPPGTGPFVFKEWRLNEYTRFVRNKDYYEKGLPYVDMVSVIGIPDATARFTALRTGEIDWLTTLPLGRVPMLQKNPPPGITVFVSKGMGRHQIFFNLKDQVLGKPNPFSDVRVRRAVAYAIDKKEILQGASWGYGDVLQGQVYSPLEPWSVDVSDYAQNLEKARALLAEAGYPKGFKALLPLRSDDPRKRGSEVTAAQLKKIGIELELKLLADAEYYRTVNRMREFTITYEALPYRDDPDDGYYLYLHSKSPSNPTGYANPEFDRLLEEARGLTGREERKKVYKKVVEKIHEDVPWIWTHSNNLPYAWRDYLKCDCAPGEENCFGFGGWFASANGGFKRVWLDK